MKKALYLVMLTLSMVALVAVCAKCSSGTWQEIVIRYSDRVTNTMEGGGESDRDEAQPGYVYLVLDLYIENRGYDSFEANHSYFYVVVDKVRYEPAFVAALENELKVVDLLDGERTRGKVAFEVPAKVLSLGYQVGYEAF